ncbi:MAG TPA: hypothetical protein PKW61_00065 [Tenuifilaceae bacterium]|nr:hypothetical protein [Tenuifilaceae bacterium]
MKTKIWQIVDDKGVIHSASQEEVQLIWDLMTRTIDDLASEYRHTYSKRKLIQLKKELTIKSWAGDLKLIEVHNVFR